MTPLQTFWMAVVGGFWVLFALAVITTLLTKEGYRHNEACAMALLMFFIAVIGTIILCFAMR